ncbi:MAG TPA: NAD(P)/FAD-dependent oxidoreductase [Caulobacteraceae bacterium]|jgi:cation diffusion facilitator CzcD-associated flavoprotein CzcO|nr:NAD(P)/FAD-dependent oxidoreductase [Caulobacteraceae bacterium]
MTDAATLTRPTQAAETRAEHFDVLIVGAGISGIGGAYHMRTQCPDKSFVVLETKPSFGGTWHTHRYPGVRSDSDLFTFGYRFKAWVGAPIASGDEILKYMGEVIDENDLGRHIRYGHTITNASWSSEDNLWTVEAVRKDTGEEVRFTTGFLWMAQGYFRQSEGYTPEWEGMADFKGRIVHPQTWPQDLDYKGKRVIIIGSGATAATLAPSIAADVEHVTMLQRSPTYFVPGRNVNELAETLRALKIDENWIHEIVRRQVLANGGAFTQRTFEQPEEVRKELLGLVATYLPQDQVDKHFTPSYRPWRQRIAFMPNGDLFEGMKTGKVSVVTDEIDRFTEKGIRVKSGEEIEADIIVTATGFNLNVLGDIDFVIDGKPLDFAETVTYRGMMFTGVPNLVWVFGYFRASWTLRSELIADFVCRLLNHMEARQAHRVTVALRPEEKDMELGSWIDPENFNPGYLMRGMHLLPKRGATREWQHTQDYWTEKDEFPAIDLDDEVFVYG